jgi:hypothetical protein
MKNVVYVAKEVTRLSVESSACKLLMKMKWNYRSIATTQVACVAFIGSGAGETSSSQI